MRNLEKDEIEMAAKRERMLAVGFRIFSENTIEVATMKEIAKACGLGYKTMFRYFGTKTAFVIAIGAEKWKEYAVKVEEMYRARGSTYRIVIGDPVPWQTFDHSRRPAEWAAWMKRKVENL